MNSLYHPYNNSFGGPQQVPLRTPLVIDWAHPITNGLMGAWVPGIMGPVDIAKNLTLTSQSAAKFSECIEGPGLNSQTTASGMLGTVTPEYKSITDVSMFWRGYNVSAPVANAVYIGVGYDATGVTNPYYIYALRESAGKLQLIWNSSGAYVTVNSSNSLPTSGLNSFATTMVAGNPGTLKIFINGRMDALGNNQFVSPTSTATSSVLWNQDGTSLSDRVTHAISTCAYFWNRALSDEEMSYLSLHPYDFVIPGYAEQSQALFSGISFIPAWTQQINLPVIGAGTY